MNRGFLLAFLLSVILHALVAVGIAHCTDFSPTPDVTVRLDVTRMELSFAEMPDETAAVASVPVAVARDRMLPKPKPEGPPMPEPTEKTGPRMPQPDATDLPQPEESSRPTPFQSTAAPRQAQIDAPPKPRSSIRPDYPKKSRQRGEQGCVTLDIDVNANGTVDDVRVAKTSGFPLLDEAAVRCARAARFTPAKSAGSPVATTVRLVLEFRLK